jgi:hypothetical protein
MIARVVLPAPLEPIELPFDVLPEAGAPLTVNGVIYRVGTVITLDHTFARVILRRFLP